ncbi:ABC transporter [Mycoplasmopsis pullorum]|uniref:ABC transporter ATP-binding protein n=1 Tax=Mycoplasmopsis pullorum TaxID=48003 RepID=UPI00111B0337|nr:ABC transporter ATP-binding protein [Mycoplasmopsis pullorum]TNK83914.1 ABC transporter [Mycoplasmopsis pullorum]TNK92057.1 ABC transporter [Mycoplasmopsis pullorum]
MRSKRNKKVDVIYNQIKSVSWWDQTKGYRTVSFLSAFFVILEVVIQLFMPKVNAYLLQDSFDTSNGKVILAQLFKWGSILFSLAIGSIIFGVLSGIASSKGAAGIARNLRMNMFANIQKFSFSNLDKYTTGSLMIRLTNDITNVQNAYMQIIRTLVRAPIMLVGAIVMAFTINTKMATIFLGAVLALTIMLSLIIGFAFPLFGKMLKSYDRLNNKIKENIYAIKTIKAFVTEEKELEEVKNLTARLKKISIKSERLVALNNPVLFLTIYGLTFLILFVGTKSVVSRNMEWSELIALISYMWQVVMSLMLASMVFVMVTIAHQSSIRIKEVLNEKPSITSPQNGKKEILDGSIEFNNVSFKYNLDTNIKNLKNINLKINSGETIGIIGKTGSGKSTLVQLLPRLYDISEGELKIAGTPIQEYDLMNLRDAISIVLQKNTLFKGTLRENMKWGNLSASDEEIKTALKNSAAYDFVFSKDEGLNQIVEEKGNNFSGGQKQRLCIARALIKKPKILILDDSTSAVDNRTQKLIQNAFEKNLKDTTKLIIAQRINSIEHADKIIVMNNGEIEAFGTHDELLKNNKFYHGLYVSQTQEDDNE